MKIELISCFAAKLRIISLTVVIVCAGWSETKVKVCDRSGVDLVNNLLKLQDNVEKPISPRAFVRRSALLLLPQQL